MEQGEPKGLIAGNCGRGGRLTSQIIGGNTAYKRNQFDFYPTPPDVTRALLNFLKLPDGTVVWEPACGDGHMVEEMKKHGLIVKESDISTGEDFLKIQQKACDWIITNPPFSLSEKFIERCMEHKKPFAMLLKAQYWHAKRRVGLFRISKPTYILPLTWRPDFLFKTRGRGASLMDVMWGVWEVNKSDIPHTYYIPLERPK